MTAAVLAWALTQLEHGSRVVLASVVTSSGSVPGKSGARLAMRSGDEHWVGTVGGAGLEMMIFKECKSMLEHHARPAGKVLTYGLNKGAKGYEVTALDSLCGGRVTLSLEVLIPMPHVLLIGGGHCAQAIAPALDALGWDHSVHDTRADFCDAATFPNARHHLHMDAPTFVSTQKSDELSKYSDVLLLGHDWSEDQLRLLGMLSTLQSQAVRLDGQDGPRIGVIGSRSKWQAFEKAALQEGISQGMLDQVICPIGIPIGAESPEEIAVAVVAQIMAAHKGVNPTEPSWR
ncbi:XdhC/CoxI family protein [Candidatus Poseidoniales archaeon]|nr:XdhC/CoxI family protein [Candidatus Poseidoniales archaeon]MDB2624515.1 XdhC/CoxI family protein [Candidatus Poseidoniales archaeon]